MSHPSPLQAPVAPWYKHRWPWLLMVGPGLSVIVGSVMGYIAFTQPDALVVGDYYKQGKAINQDLRRDTVASNLAMDTRLAYDVAQGRLTGSVHSFGKAYQAPLQLHLAHATLPEKDIRLLVQPDAQGNFSVALPMLERSRWQVLVENDKREWRLSGIWSWPVQRAITLRADEEL
ncbi:FixH family protein [Janthinobacterium sp. Mn2066]|uniref:FixH family protein n=1 Tax=Janthinobacterium sp. Mn2066 TaxID=3395264 RepID=UPI003BBC5759